MTSDNRNVELAAALTVAWLENQHTRPAADDVPAFLASMHKAVSNLAGKDGAFAAAADPVTDYPPAVSVRKSLASPDKIISMIDGKGYSSLKRHLTANGLTPDEYRQRYGLKADYPMVAPGYSKARSETAKRVGLGRKAGQKVAKETASSAADPTPKAGRGKGKSFADATAAARQHLGGAETDRS